MSAAKKLKELDAAMTDAPWYVSDDEDDLLGLVDGDLWPLGFANANAQITTLRNALPELIAVVERAESVTSRVVGVSTRLSTTLAALDEALTTRTEPRTAAESTK